MKATTFSKIALASALAIGLSACDSDSNDSETADSENPVITLLGDATLYLEQGSLFQDPGVTVSDNVDTDLTATVGGDLVDTSLVATYTITYDATDAAGNKATQLTRTVHVVEPSEETPPILINGDFAADIVDEWYFDTAGSEANANLNLMDGELVVNITALGANTWEGRLIQATTTVLTDGQMYQISFDAKSSVARDINVNLGKLFDAAPYFTALMEAQTVSLTTTMESYDITFTADNSQALEMDLLLEFGNGAVADITFDNISITEYNGVDTEAPVISLVGDAVMHVDTGTVFTDPGVTVTDNIDSGLSATVGGDVVDTSVDGTYVVTYDAVDLAGNSAVQVSRSVVVSTADLIAPVITLVGESSVDVELNETYVDAGATANDNIDGDLTSAIVVDTSGVDTSVLGVCTVTYNVTDSVGNEAEQVVRTVYVIEPAAEEPSASIIINGDFETALAGEWYFDAAGSVASGDLNLVDGELVVSLTELGANSWEGRIIQKTTSVLTHGQTYQISFDAKADEARDITVNIGKLFDADPWFTSLMEGQTVTLTTTLERHSLTFIANNPDSLTTDVLLEFGGGAVTDITLDNISVSEVTP